MKCANCYSIIPDDSKFCPDCGCRIQDIESVRNEVRNLIDNNREAYNFLLSNKLIPRFVHNSTLDSCNAILSKSNEIILKQKQINTDRETERKRLEQERQEKQRREEELRRQRELEEQRKKEEKERREREETELRKRASLIKEQCMPERTGYILTTILLVIVIYVWSCIEQPYEAFGKNLVAPVLSIFIYPALLAIFSPYKRQKENIKQWKASHPNDPVCKYL